MNKKLKKEIKWLNENLKALIMNQTMLYMRVMEIEKILLKMGDKKE